MITLYCRWCACASTVTDCGSPFHGRWTKLEDAERATRMACDPSASHEHALREHLVKNINREHLVTNIDVSEACCGWFSFMTARQDRIAAEDNICPEHTLNEAKG